MTLIYLVVTLAFVGIVVIGIVRLRKIRPNGFLIGILGALPFSVLVMIKLRCLIDTYPCGFMAFTGGLPGTFLWVSSYISECGFLPV